MNGAEFIEEAVLPAMSATGPDAIRTARPFVAVDFVKSHGLVPAIAHGGNGSFEVASLAVKPAVAVDVAEAHWLGPVIAHGGRGSAEAALVAVKSAVCVPGQQVRVAGTEEPLAEALVTIVGATVSMW